MLEGDEPLEFHLERRAVPEGNDSTVVDELEFERTSGVVIDPKFSPKFP